MELSHNTVVGDFEATGGLGVNGATAAGQKEISDITVSSTDIDIQALATYINAILAVLRDTGICGEVVG